MLDYLFTNATIVDGTGAPAYQGTVGIEGDQIVTIIRDGSALPEAKKVIDATGKVLCPGFIDIHSHADETVTVWPNVDNCLVQGVTTFVGGNCGGSEAPSKAFPAMADFLAAVEQARPSINSATLVGHGTVRKAVMGYSRDEATDEQIAQMQALTAKAMEEGAFGISTGLIYPPSCYSTTDELVRVVSAVAPYGGY